MTRAFQIRLVLLVGGILAVAGLTVSSVQDSWRRIVEVEKQLTGSQMESFRLAEDFQRRLQEANSSIMRFVARQEPAGWADFEQASGQLDRWLEQHDPRLDRKDPKLTTQRERELFQQLNDRYDGYLATARRLQTIHPLTMASTPPLTQLEEFDGQARRLLQLGNELAEAHRVAKEAFLANTDKSLANVRYSLYCRMGILLALVAALGWYVYRDAIAPLRSRLVHSQMLLQKQQKLATLGTLAAGIAHEIRNPLTSLKARLYTLQKHFESPPLARKDVEIISTEILRLERIVQDVLSFARPSEPEFKPVSVQTLLREVHALMASSLDSQRIRFILEAAPNLSISADAAHLKQVLINLVRNAAEAIEGEGTVTLRARADHLRFNGEVRDVVVLEVTDTGRGMPPEVEDRLFDPFFSTKDTGTGLGLSIAARIIEKHHGSIRYQTRVGHGTTFGIVLPQMLSSAMPPLLAAASASL